MDEKGTEAAAATAVKMVAVTAMLPPPEPPPQVFNADHPYLFFLRDVRTGLILFMGRVADPAST
jgi:serpin B